MLDLASDAGTISAPADFTADLDSTFSDTADPGAVDTSTVDQSGDPGYQQRTNVEEPEVITAAPDFTAPKEPVVPEKVDTKPTEELDLEQEIGEPKEVDYRGKPEWHFTKAKGQVLMANHKFASELRQAIPGLTIEDAKQYYASDTQLQQVVNNFLYDGHVNLTHQLLATAKRANNPEAFGKFAREAVVAVSQTDPKAFQAIAEPIISQFRSQYLDQLQTEAINDFNQAQAAGDRSKTDIAAYALYSAQMQAYKATGKYKRASDSRQDSGQPEISQREADLARRVQDYERSQQQTRQQEAQQWNTTFDSDRDSRVQTAIDKGLEQAKAHISPASQQAWKTHIATLVKDKVEGDANLKSRIDLDRQTAFRTGEKSLRDGVIERWVGRAQSVIRAELQKLITEHTNADLAKNGQAHAALEKSAARREPGGGITPVPKTIVPPPSQNGNKVDFKRELDEAFANM